MAEGMLLQGEDGELKVVLVMTPTEANTVRKLCGMILGDPTRSRRRDTDAVYLKLGEIGIRGDGVDMRGVINVTNDTEN